MIPNKNGNTTQETAQVAEKMGSFNLFDPVHFVQRVLRNWYWFVILGFLGYCISYVYSKYYAQRVYSSSLSLSISNNTSSYFTPNQSINFIWGQGGNQDGIFLKKILLSRSHNEYLVKQLNLNTNYTTKGLIKTTYLDQEDSPFFLEIDKNHFKIFTKDGFYEPQELQLEGKKRMNVKDFLNGFRNFDNISMSEN